MGRYYFDAKTTVEQATQLSIFKLKEFGLLRGYSASTLTWTHKASGKQDSIGITVDIEDEPYVKVNYTITDRTTGEKTKYDYKISLTSTPCHFGGVRYWFICPLSVNGVYCGRRTGTLYIASGGNYFGCRHCYNLSYQSRNEPRFARPGGMFYPLKLDGQVEKLNDKIKRWSYKSKPTRKVRKLRALEQRMERAYAVSNMLLKRQGIGRNK